MTYLFRFRRCILLLLSLTLSAQAMAVASLGACHRIKAMTTVQEPVLAAAHHHGDAAAHHDGAVHHADAVNTSPWTEEARLSCAACAACHATSIIPNTETSLPDALVADATIFPDTDVPRARNVASGLERPPRA